MAVMHPESDINLTNQQALEYIRPFFEHEWVTCRAQDIAVSSLIGGYCSSIWKVTRKNAQQSDSEPPFVLVKLRGGKPVDIEEFEQFDDRLHAIVAYEMSKRGLGPTIYGLFPGGSIEEYIPSHTLTYEEAADPEISADIAIAIARAHCIQGLPLRKNSSDEILDYYHSCYQKFLDRTDKETICEQYDLDFDTFVNLDFESEIKWFKQVVKNGKFRKNFILTDVNFNNCLVKDDKSIKSKTNSRVMLIDYDGPVHSLRGIDLGTHFFYRLFKKDASGFIPDGKQLADAEKRYFLTCYQQEIKNNNLWPDFDENGIDSVDNLLIEAALGQAHTCFMLVSIGLGLIDIMGKIFGKSIPFDLKCYFAAKEEVVAMMKVE